MYAATEQETIGGEPPATDVRGSAVGRGFLVGMLLLTAVPLCVIPAASLVTGQTGQALGVAWFVLLNMTGQGHVASSGFFYFDREFSPLIRAHPWRCLWSILLLPLTLLVATVLLTVFAGTWGLVALHAFHNTWLFHHYQRQNYGLIRLVGTNVGAGPPPRGLNLVLGLPVAAGIVSVLGLPAFYPPSIDWVVSPAMSGWCRSSGIALYAIAFASLVIFVATSPSLRRTPAVWLAVTLSWAFFLPCIASDRIEVAFLPLAIAHGAQYLAMMSVASARSPLGGRGLVATGVLAAGFAYVTSRYAGWLALGPLLAGATEVHFLLDARVWRLRDELPRRVIGQRFDFLFPRGRDRRVD